MSFWKNLWCLSAKTSSFAFSLRYCKLVILGTLDMPGYAHLKMIVSTYRKLLCLTSKKSTLSPMFSWRYCKDMYINFFYFGYFGNVWLRKPKIIVLTCRKLWCLSACQKQTSPFTSSLEYYILRNPAPWLANNILTHQSRTNILPDMKDAELTNRQIDKNTYALFIPAFTVSVRKIPCTKFWYL